MKERTKEKEGKEGWKGREEGKEGNNLDPSYDIISYSTISYL